MFIVIDSCFERQGEYDPWPASEVWQDYPKNHLSIDRSNGKRNEQTETITLMSHGRLNLV